MRLLEEDTVTSIAALLVLAAERFFRSSLPRLLFTLLRAFFLRHFLSFFCVFYFVIAEEAAAIFFVAVRIYAELRRLPLSFDFQHRPLYAARMQRE